MALSKNKKEKTKKKGKKWIVVLVIALILGAGSCGGDTDSEEKPVENESVVEEVATIEESTEEQVEVVETVEEEPMEVEEEVDNLTLGQKNALKSAKSYLDFAAFSYNGLIKQLEYEGYTNEEAVFAVLLKAALTGSAA